MYNFYLVLFKGEVSIDCFIDGYIICLKKIDKMKD